LTALANDYGYERVFARQIEALARSGDLLFAISASNVRLAIGSCTKDSAHESVE
jgi:D-sedoheptulose 7-phosphate isomerase